MSVNRKYLRDKIANALLIGDDAIEISRLCLALLDEVDVLDEDLENTRMRLIACQCVAEANTREGAKNMRDVQEAWRSPAFHSVCTAVDREIDLREKLEEEEAEAARMKRAWDSAFNQAMENGQRAANAEAREKRLRAALTLARKTIADSRPGMDHSRDPQLRFIDAALADTAT